jgi:hypothetical protein
MDVSKSGGRVTDMQNRASVASLVAAGSVLLGPILASTAAASRYQLTRVNSR